MYVHDEPSTQVAYSTKQTKAMLGYLNKANEEEAVNGRTDRGNERGMSKKEACMNTATTNRGCYSMLSSTLPQVGSGGWGGGGSSEKQLRHRISISLSQHTYSAAI